MDAKTKLRKKLRDKAYRDAFVRSQNSVGIPFQVRALRTQHQMDQKELGELAGMAQPRISAIESPGNHSLNLKTLLKIASAFDVGLIVRFAPFSELIRFADDSSPDEFEVLDFASDMETAADTKPSGDQPNSKVVCMFTRRPLQPVITEGSMPIESVINTKQEPVIQNGRQEPPVDDEHPARRRRRLSGPASWFGVQAAHCGTEAVRFHRLSRTGGASYITNELALRWAMQCSAWFTSPGNLP